MNMPRVMRTVKALASGALLLQATGCDIAAFNEFLQTTFLGITAAGAIAIIQNI